MNIFTCCCNWIKRSAFGFDRSSQKSNLIGLKQFKNITGHFGLHLMKLLMLGWSIHLKRHSKSVVVLWLASERSSETTRMRIHVEIIHFIRANIIQSKSNQTLLIYGNFNYSPYQVRPIHSPTPTNAIIMIEAFFVDAPLKIYVSNALFDSPKARWMFYYRFFRMFSQSLRPMSRGLIFSNTPSPTYYQNIPTSEQNKVKTVLAN